MKDKLISSTTAKLAKKKGFFSHSEYAYLGTKCIDTNALGYISNKNHKDDSWCEAPTQSLLQKWLREKHRIHLSIMPRTTKLWWWQIENLDEYEGECFMAECNFTTEKYKSFESALEAALKTALILI